MKTKKLEIRVAIQIQKNRHEVFEAIVDPEKMSGYFISKSSGRMEEGKQLLWNFPEFDIDVPLRVGKVQTDTYVSYYWNHNDKELFCEMSLKDTPDKQGTVVSITEKEMDMDDEGITWLMGNTEGWANFLACLKAYLEHGVNLRKNAFDFMRS